MAKQVTPAMKKILDYRASLVRNFDVSECIQDENLLFTIYKYKKSGRICAVAFKGRAKKPIFNYHYKSEAVRDERIAQWIEQTRSIAITSKATKVNTLKVGDVLKLSFGYYGTVVEFYLVQELVGKASVGVVKIGNTRIDVDSVIPDITNVLSESFVKRVNNNSITIEGRRATLVPVFNIRKNGTKIFEPQFIDSEY